MTQTSKNSIEKFSSRILNGVGRRARRLRRQIAMRLGLYDRWREIDWARVERIVFVCTGNICRSPYAEKVVEKLGVHSVSCGLMANGGAPADSVAIEVAADRGIDLRKHSSRNIADVSVNERDLLVVMDLGHLERIRPAKYFQDTQVTILGLWGDSRDIQISDPFSLSPVVFEECFQKIDACLVRLLESRSDRTP